MTALEHLEEKLYPDELILSALDNFEKTYPLVCAAGGCSLDTHPTKHNWVEDAGGLPQYICEIARAILRDGSGTKDVGRAISIAVSRCKVWAAGGGNVDADTRAKAAKAVAEWEAKKAKAKAS